jgi:hypothetical protein
MVIVAFFANNIQDHNIGKLLSLSYFHIFPDKLKNCPRTLEDFKADLAWVQESTTSISEEHNTPKNGKLLFVSLNVRGWIFCTRHLFSLSYSPDTKT